MIPQDQPFQALLARLDRLSDQFRGLKEGVLKAIDIADRDPEMSLTRARKVLEHVVREVYERRINEPPGTRPLENLLQRLVKDGHFPERLNAYANTVRMLGNVGTHSFGEKVSAADVYQSLTQLMPILEWYFETERPEALGQQAAQTRTTEPTNLRPGEQPPAVRPEFRIAIVPKGLRSFDANDAKFFLELLPGPRDETGLPESIRFWKHRIEAKNELTFTVGVIYGPSGCGKSSLVKAGLLPRLAAHVLAEYVEASADGTEARLLRGLRKRCPELPGDLDLTATLSALRQGQGRRPGQKVLLVLDQFEQWLHAKRQQDNPELVQALRQCDGDRLQCVVLVRDDFWLALSRFLGDLNIELVQGQNAALVDLFDPRHAKKVLAAFGRAFGVVEEVASKEQEAFLDHAVGGLAQDGRVISVRLALFAEMVKDKPWTPATLKEVGGAEGVGVAFLEGTFAAATAPPQHRLHQKAAQAVLKALLPESGSDIKGHIQAQRALLEASGYASHPKDFDQLLHILDGELRLITPTDPEGVAEQPHAQRPAQSAGTATQSVTDAISSPATRHPPPATLYYQLTHDYLVPSLRAWLTRKQKETRRGRAELRLGERAAAWNAKPETRQLPSWWEWASILLLTHKKDWAPAQKRMMRQAARFHGLRGLLVTAGFAIVALTGFGVWNQVLEQRRADQAAGLVGQLLAADIAQVPRIVEDLQDYRTWANPLLRQAAVMAEKENDPRKQLHVSLALMPVDSSQFEALYARLLNANPEELPVIRNALRGQQQTLVERLEQVLADAKEDPEKRLRAACALAGCEAAPDSALAGCWEPASSLIVKQLLAAVQKNPSHYTPLLELLRPVRGTLLAPLGEVCRNKEHSESERTWATSIVADYASGQPEILAELLLDGDDKQFKVLLPILQKDAERAQPVLRAEVAKQPAADAQEPAKEKLAKRQANAAVALLRMGEAEKVSPLLKHRPDPRVRSYLIHRLSPLGADPKAILKLLDAEKDISIRRALLLSLGEFSPEQLSVAEREAVLPSVLDLYGSNPDPGVHAAAEWLLRQWQQEQVLKQVGEEWVKTKVKGVGWWVVGKDKDSPPATHHPTPTTPTWYVNSQGQTMVVIPGPVEFVMGSPPSEEGRMPVESQHKRRIGRTFAIAATAVTKEQFLRFLPKFGHSEMRRYREPTCPIGGVVWYEAAAYCNWLSKQEEIAEDQWCYETNAQGQVTKLKENYLSRTGYRLPTEAEMECATRAKAVTSRYYGETEELLPKYGWYFANAKERTWPVGSKKPNELGLFDMHGNVYTWCQEKYTIYPQGGEGKPVDDIEDDLSVNSTDSRVLRGGAFTNRARNVRSASRNWDVPTYRLNGVGLRPARTFR